MPGSSPGVRRRWSPALVFLHFAAAQLALLAAALLIAAEPSAIASSPLHPATLASVHLVTLGFLATSIVGASHALGPLVLRTELPARALDWWLLLALVAAAFGVPSHMLLGTYLGVAWSGGLLLVLLLLHLLRLLPRLVLAPVPLPLRVGAALAWTNFLLAVVLGMTLAIDRDHPLLPAGHQQGLLVHAHLAAGGFVATMAVAMGLRLMPMFLPGEAPRGLLPWCAVLGTGLGGTACGTLGLLLPAALPFTALVMALGLLAFVLSMLQPLRHRKPAPKDQRRNGAASVLQAFALLALLATVGAGLRVLIDANSGPPQQLAYGSLALLGFLGALVFGMGQRLLPLVAWFAARAGYPPGEVPPPQLPPHALPHQGLAWTCALLFMLGVVLLVTGVAIGAAGAVRAGAIGIGLAAVTHLLLLRHVWRRARSEPTRPTPD